MLKAYEIFQQRKGIVKSFDMKKYTKIYYDFFGYDESDTILCECCGKVAVDIMHIYAKSIRKDLENDIINLMAGCRECHNKYGDKKQYYDYLNDIHKNNVIKRLYEIGKEFKEIF